MIPEYITVPVILSRSNAFFLSRSDASVSHPMVYNYASLCSGQQRIAGYIGNMVELAPYLIYKSLTEGFQWPSDCIT
jgi:hypothetical protein